MQRSPTEDLLKNLQARWLITPDPAPHRDMNPAMQQFKPPLPSASSWAQSMCALLPQRSQMLMNVNYPPPTPKKISTDDRTTNSLKIGWAGSSHAGIRLAPSSFRLSPNGHRLTLT
jgi:hypothetical protein